MDKIITKYLNNTDHKILCRDDNWNLQVDFKFVGYTKSFDTLKSLESFLYNEAYKSFKKPFYLEISGRQTGKTTRMIEDMHRHIEQGGIACICCSTTRMTNHIKNIFMEKYKSLDRVISWDTYEHPEHSDGYDKRVIRNYFDEFDFNERASFDPNGYYCTTACRVRNIRNFLPKSNNNVEVVFNTLNDFLFYKLVNHCNHNFESHKNTSITHTMIGDRWEVESGKIWE
jgi:hypothetical protein